MIHKIFTLAVVFLICTTLWGQQDKDNGSVELLVEWLTGSFQNTTQRMELDSSISSVPARSGKWLNELCLRHVKIDAPALGSHVLYLTWRELDCEAGVINRHRIWSFRQDSTGNIEMDFFAFPADSSPDDHLSVETLQVDRLVGYPAGCTVVWTWQNDHFWGRLQEVSCQTVAQISRRVIQLGAEIKAAAHGFSYKEIGIYEQGEVAFSVPGGFSYQFEKKVP